jgi:4-amino-4-deoxy-L-arabinose transferase-like glycosyltransferase
MSKLDSNRIQRWDMWRLLIVLVIAAVMRLGEPGISEFFHDEAMLSMLAQDMADGQTLPLLGILSSVGIPNPPTSVYVMAVPFLITDDPLFATLFVAVLNVFGVALLWLLAHRYFNPTVALIAGAVYALNPWAVLYSRKIWAQDFHTPFLLAALLLGLHGFLEGKRWAQMLCLPLLLFALQIHFAAWALLPLYFWLLWTGRSRISRRAIIVTLVLSGLILLPYVVGLMQTLDQDPRRISDAVGRSGAGSLSFSNDALASMTRLATGLGLETWVAPEQQVELLTNISTPAALWSIVGLVVVIGIGVIWRLFGRDLGMLLILWLVLPVLAFTPTFTPVYTHYFIGSIPALAILAGIGLVGLLRWIPGKSISRIVIVSGFGVILLTQGFWWRDLLYYLDNTNTTMNGFTTPVHYLLEVRDELATYDDVVIISDGMRVLFDKEPARWSVMLRHSATCIRTLEGDGYAVFPDGLFAAAIAPNAPENAVGDLYLDDDPVILPVRPGDGEYRISVFDNGLDWSGPPLTSVEPSQFDTGVEFTGYHLTEDRMYLAWRLPEAQPGLDYQYSAHFLDSTGERLGQRDTQFWPGRHWCAGDRLITWVDIELPDGVETLRIALYKLGTGRDLGRFFSANVLDEAGNPAGQWVDIVLSDYP